MGLYASLQTPAVAERQAANEIHNLQSTVNLSYPTTPGQHLNNKPMCPSLEQKYNQLVPPENRDELADLEDMTGRKLTLHSGDHVTIIRIDLTKGTHQYTRGQGFLLTRPHTAKNTDDIYQ